MKERWIWSSSGFWWNMTLPHASLIAVRTWSSSLVLYTLGSESFNISFNIFSFTTSSSTIWPPQIFTDTASLKSFITTLINLFFNDSSYSLSAETTLMNQAFLFCFCETPNLDKIPNLHSFTNSSNNYSSNLSSILLSSLTFYIFSFIFWYFLTSLMSTLWTFHQKIRK